MIKLTESRKILKYISEDYDLTPSERVVKNLEFVTGLSTDRTWGNYVECLFKSDGNYYVITLDRDDFDKLKPGSKIDIATRTKDKESEENMSNTLQYTRIIKDESPEDIQRRKDKERQLKLDRARETRRKRKEAQLQKDTSSIEEVNRESLDIDELYKKSIESLKLYNSVMDEARSNYNFDNGYDKDSDYFDNDDYAVDNALNIAADSFSWAKRVFPKLNDEDEFVDFINGIVDNENNEENIKNHILRYMK